MKQRAKDDRFFYLMGMVAGAIVGWAIGLFMGASLS